MLNFHLQEIEDAAARDGVNAFKTQMEIVVLSLLDENRTTALSQIEEARLASLATVDQLSSPSFSATDGAKAGRVARALLGHSFSRLRAVIEAPDDNIRIDPDPQGD